MISIQATAPTTFHDARFVQLLAEANDRQKQMRVRANVIVQGPFWAGYCGTGYAVKNKHNDVLIDNVSVEQADEIAKLLTRMEKPPGTH